MVCKLFLSQKRSQMALTAETIARAPEQMIKGRVEIKTTILSDSMEKCQTMHAEIIPIYPDFIQFGF